MSYSLNPAAVPKASCGCNNYHDMIAKVTENEMSSIPTIKWKQLFLDSSYMYMNAVVFGTRKIFDLGEIVSMMAYMGRLCPKEVLFLRL